MKHFTKQNSSLCILHGTIGIQINNIVYTSKQKHYQFSSKNSSATKKSPQSNVYYMEFFLIFLFEYSFIDIVKLKFTRRNEMWCRILEIEDLSKKVRKTQDRTSLISLVHSYLLLLDIPYLSSPVHIFVYNELNTCTYLLLPDHTYYLLFKPL